VSSNSGDTTNHVSVKGRGKKGQKRMFRNACKGFPSRKKKGGYSYIFLKRGRQTVDQVEKTEKKKKKTREKKETCQLESASRTRCFRKQSYCVGSKGSPDDLNGGPRKDWKQTSKKLDREL